VHVRPGVPAETVPLIRGNPTLRRERNLWPVAPVLDKKAGLLRRRMPEELCAKLAVVPRPIVLVSAPVWMVRRPFPPFTKASIAAFCSG